MGQNAALDHLKPVFDAYFKLKDAWWLSAMMASEAGSLGIRCCRMQACNGDVGTLRAHGVDEGDGTTGQ